jgi:hypothetical protein
MLEYKTKQTIKNRTGKIVLEANCFHSGKTVISFNTKDSSMEYLICADYEEEDSENFRK